MHKNIRTGAHFQVKWWKTKVFLSAATELQKAKHIFLKKKIHVALVQKLKTQLLHLSVILMAIFIIKVNSFGCCLLCGMRYLQRHQLTKENAVAVQHCLFVCAAVTSGFFCEWICLHTYQDCRDLELLFDKYNSTDWLLSPFFKRPYLGQCLISAKELNFAKQSCSTLVGCTFKFYLVVLVTPKTKKMGCFVFVTTM